MRLPRPWSRPRPQPAQGNSLEERIDEALRKAQQASDAPQQPAQPATRGPDQPTMVRSESYPAGWNSRRRRASTTSAIADMNGGQLPAPFGTATQGTLSAQPAAAPVPYGPGPVSASRDRSASSKECGCSGRTFGFPYSCRTYGHAVQRFLGFLEVSSRRESNSEGSDNADRQI